MKIVQFIIIAGLLFVGLKESDYNLIFTAIGLSVFGALNDISSELHKIKFELELFNIRERNKK